MPLFRTAKVSPTMNHILESERLRLRELHPGDAGWFYELNNDPLVMQYTGDPPFADLAEARIFLENYKPYSEYGYGRWAVELAGTGNCIGWCGLKYSPERDETDLGFRLFRNQWGRGYATEAARACVRHGFGPLGLAAIVGRAMAPNLASVRVLEKTGFRFVKEEKGEPFPWLLFRLDASEGVCR